MVHKNTNKDKNQPPSLSGRAGVEMKVCGMKSNTEEVAALQPDYLGFIFWEPSKRYFEGTIPKLPDTIRKVGVFVDAPLEDILEKVTTHGLSLVQLHGKESAAFCETLKNRAPKLGIIKVFAIKDDFDFSVLAPFESVCDFFLFDTKGKLPGGNGYAFDWTVLENYPSTKPYFLSGGIGPEEIDSINAFLKRPEARYCQVIDINSRFEVEPGLKDAEALLEFKRALEL